MKVVKGHAQLDALEDFDEVDALAEEFKEFS